MPGVRILRLLKKFAGGAVHLPEPVPTRNRAPYANNSLTAIYENAVSSRKIQSGVKLPVPGFCGAFYGHEVTRPGL
jgi:hypothetical protein